MEKLVVISKKELKIINDKGEIIEHIISDDKDLIDFYKTIFKGKIDYKNLYEKEDLK